MRFVVYKVEHFTFVKACFEEKDESLFKETVKLKSDIELVQVSNTTKVSSSNNDNNNNYLFVFFKIKFFLNGLEFDLLIK